MPAWAAVIIAVVGTSTTIGTVYLGIMKARDDRRARESADERLDRTDIVTMITNDRDYWRGRAERAEQKVDALKDELAAVRIDAEHVADVAQAALLAFQQGRTQVSGGND